MSWAGNSLVHNVILHKGFVGGAGGKTISEKIAAIKVENEIRLCLCYGKYSVLMEIYAKGKGGAQVKEGEAGEVSGPD